MKIKRIFEWAWAKYTVQLLGQRSKTKQARIRSDYQHMQFASTDKATELWKCFFNCFIGTSIHPVVALCCHTASPCTPCIYHKQDEQHWATSIPPGLPVCRGPAPWCDRGYALSEVLSRWTNYVYSCVSWHHHTKISWICIYQLPAASWW